MTIAPDGVPAVPARAFEHVPEDLRPDFDRAWSRGIQPVSEMIRWFGRLGWSEQRAAKATAAPGWAAIKDGDPAMRVDAAAACLAWACRGWLANDDWGGIEVWLNLRKTAGAIRFSRGRVTARQARLLCGLAARDRGEGVAIGATRAFLDGGGDLADIEADVQDLLERLKHGDANRHVTSLPGMFDAPYRESAELARRRVQIEELLVSAAAPPSQGDTSSLIGGTDAVAGWARDELARSSGDQPAGLVRHLRRPLAGVPPSTKWSSRTRELLQASADGPAFVLALLQRAADADLRPHGEIVLSPSTSLFDQSTQELLRSAVWSATIEPRDGAEAHLLRLARRCGERIPGVGPPAPKVCTAAVHALAAIGSADAIAGLGELSRRLKNPSLLAQVDKALGSASGRTAMSRARLREASIPDLGLDPTGRRSFPLMTHRAALVEMLGAKRVATSWWEGEHSSRTVPRAWKTDHADEIRDVKAYVAKARSALANERARQEGLLLEDDRWELDDWRRIYVEHPLAAAVADGLLWSLESAGARRTVICRDRRLLDIDGSVIRPAPGATLRLWHPIDAPVDEVEAWRNHLVSAAVQQPFKQAFREVYPLTPAERESGDHSRRFAGQLLDAPRLYFLVRERQWSMPRLGSWDGGYDAPASRRLPGTDLVAQFWAAASMGEEPKAASCITGDVRFLRGRGAKARAIDLTDVPRRAFSEAMRDIDLFISVCSLAMSPDWMLEHGDEPPGAALLNRRSSVATSRVAALERILPALAVADRCTIEDGSLHVEGRWRRYRIHIGSGHVFLEPGSRYICIVPRSIGPARNVFLPFDDDPTLAVILSKALLLADEEKITEESILSQLRPGPDS